MIPFFFQHVSHYIFTTLLKETFPLPSPESSVPSISLTFEEANALRYVAGYVCAKLYKKLKKSSAPNCKDLLAAIVDMMEDEDDDETTSAWVRAVDRGGLFKVNNRVYAFFVSMESVARNVLQLKNATDIQAGMISTKLVTTAMQDQDTLLQWSAIEIELADRDKSTLLHMIVTEYITLRGFSFAGSYVELYKQSIMQSLQKKRSLRSKLNDTDKKKGKKATGAAAVLK